MAAKTKSTKAGSAIGAKGRASRPAKPAAPAPDPVSGSEERTLRLRDLLDLAAERAGARKAAARPVIEATLALIGEALDRGEALNLPPLGKVRIGRVKDGARGAVLTVKVRRPGAPKAGGTAKAPLARTGEDD